MERVFLALAAIGGVLGYMGYEEYTVSQGASAEPTYVELAELEGGAVPDNSHLVIGPHWRIYGGSIYEYEQDVWETGEPDDSATVNYTYYPIISYEHPYILKLISLEEEYGDLEQVPDSVWPNDIGDIAVLIKTRKFRTIGAIPDDWLDAEEIQGLVINQIESLGAEERSLIRESFPSARLDKVLLLEEGRKPSSSGSAFAQLGGGAVLMILGGTGLLRRLQS